MRETCKDRAGQCAWGRGSELRTADGTYLLLLHQGRDEAALVGRSVGHWVDHQVPAEEVHSRLGAQADVRARTLQLTPTPRASCCHLPRTDRSSRPQTGPAAAAAPGPPARRSAAHHALSSGPAPCASNQGCPSCPETGPARHGSAGACRCACHPDHSPRGGSHRTTPGAHCPPCSGCPGAASQRVSIRHPPCPPLLPRSPRVTGKGGGNQREQRDGPRGWWDGPRAPRHALSLGCDVARRLVLSPGSLG